MNKFHSNCRNRAYDATALLKQNATSFFRFSLLFLTVFKKKVKNDVKKKPNQAQISSLSWNSDFVNLKYKIKQ